MPGREIRQLAKDLVAMLFVEVWRLKTEGVQKHMLCAAPPRFLFHCQQKAVTISAAAQFILHPQQIQVKPVPIDFAPCPAVDFPAWRLEGETQALEVIFSRL